MAFQKQLLTKDLGVFNYIDKLEVHSPSL